MQQQPIIKIDKSSPENQKITKKLVKNKDFTKDFLGATTEIVAKSIAYENDTYGKEFGIDFISTIQLDTEVVEPSNGRLFVVVTALVEVSIRDTVKHPLLNVYNIDKTPEGFHDKIAPNSFTYVKVVALLARLDDNNNYVRLDNPLEF